MINVSAEKSKVSQQCNAIKFKLDSEKLSVASDVNMVNGKDINATIRSKIDSIMSDCNSLLDSLKKAIEDAIDAVRREEEEEERRRQEAEARERASSRSSRWSRERAKEARILSERD